MILKVSTIFSGYNAKMLGDNGFVNLPAEKVTSNRRGKEEDVLTIISLPMDGITAEVSTIAFIFKEDCLGRYSC